MTTASLNYTNRKRINQKYFGITKKADGEESEALSLEVLLEPKILSWVTESDDIMLDLVSRGDHERFKLDLTHRQVIRPRKFKVDAKPRYRLAIIDRDGDSPGSIRASSSEIVLAPPKDPDPTKTGTFSSVKDFREDEISFFTPVESDEIGELLWKVDFSDPGRVQVLINARLVELYEGDKRNPVLRAFMFPAMVREIFSGLFSRISSIQDLEQTDSMNWFEWAKTINEDFPEEVFCGEGGVSSNWMEWLDQLIVDFSSLRFNGVDTFLSAMEVSLND